jgi:hypothetical protein
MMEKRILLILFLFGLRQAIAQNGTQTWLQDDNFQKSISVYDPNGKAFVNTYTDIEGSPFFFDDWKPCNIRLNDNKTFTHVLLKLDLQSQSVHYLGANKSEMEVQPGLIKEIEIIDSAKDNITAYKFQSGFPSVNNKNENEFFQVLAEGKVTMLKLITKKISQDKNDFTSEVKSKFITTEDYFYFSKVVMQRVRRDKSIFDLLWDQKDKVTAYIESNKLSYKSIDDIRKIITYYNSLF